jgi:hypothetical protein
MIKELSTFEIMVIDSGSNCTPAVQKKKSRTSTTVTADTTIPSGIFTVRTNMANSQRSIRSVSDKQ